MASAVFERVQAIKVKAGESGTFGSGGEFVVMTFQAAKLRSMDSSSL